LKERRKTVSKVAFLFPGEGQGSISVGMGYEIWQRFPTARAIFRQADNFLDSPLSELCFFGPEEELFEFRNSLLAPVVVGTAYAAVMDEVDKRHPDFVAGLSAGYATALIYTGVVGFIQGLKITEEAGRLIEEAARKNPGKMVVLIDPHTEEIEELCLNSDTQIGLYNSKSQIVLSGKIESTDQITQVIQEKRLARKIIPLQIEIAAHSRCIESMKAPFANFLEGISFSDPRIPIVGNCHAQLITTAEEAKQELIELVPAPVQWQRSMEVLRGQGVTTFIEIGHGRVISNILKRSMIGIAAIALAGGFLFAHRRKEKDHES